MDFGCGSAPDPAGSSQISTSKKREVRKREERQKERRKKGEREKNRSHPRFTFLARHRRICLLYQNRSSVTGANSMFSM